MSSSSNPFAELIRRDKRSFQEVGRKVQNLRGVVQALNNVQVSGDLHIVGRDLHEHHHHFYEQGVAAPPPLLSDVPNLRDIQIAILGKATAGTGHWIYRAKDFGVWSTWDGYIKFLWGTGMPGAGKTVLVSLAINAVEAHAQKSPTPVCIAFLYIRYSDQARLTVRGLLEVLVKQTIERHPAALQLCEEVYGKHAREQTEPSAQELFGLLQRFTNELIPATFYFLDALDEAPADVQIELLENLTSLNAKLFITSRPLKALQSRFPDAHHFPVVAEEYDLDVHIGKEISRSADLQAIIVDSSPGLEGRIISRVKQKCSGLFLHASLQLKALTECTNRYDLDKTLEEFPAQIADVYALTWKRVVSQPPERSTTAMGVLTWILYTTRSLTINEIRHAMATWPNPYQSEPRRLTAIETLVSTCCGLVTIEHETNLVRLVHYSAKPVLQELIPSVVPHPHSLISAICLARLVDEKLQDSSIDSTEGLEAALGSSPLLRYSYQSWVHHARKSLDDDTAKERLSRFIQGCVAFPIVPRKHGKLSRFGSLHVAAFFNLPLSLAGPAHPRDINLSTQVEGLTPLHLACMADAQHSAKELLDAPQIQINAVDVNGWTALMWASEQGSEATVELLLSDPRVEVNEVNTIGMTALHRAAQTGRTGVVRLLLAHPQVKVNQTDNFGGTPLILAAVMSKAETVKVLLGNPDIDVNVLDKGGMSALMRALMPAVGDGVEVVRALVGHPQVDVNQKHKDGWSPLQWARQYRLKDVEEILLSHPQIADSTAPKVDASNDAVQSSVTHLVED